MNTPSSIPFLPCDRGIPDNITTRGLHHFEANWVGIVICRYCGKVAPK